MRVVRCCKRILLLVAGSTVVWGGVVWGGWWVSLRKPLRQRWTTLATTHIRLALASKVQMQSYIDWLASDDIEKFNVRATVTELGLTPPESQRMYKSYYRRYMFRVFGSAEWMHAVIALGQLPADFVELIRENCRQRKALASAQGNNEPRQLRRKDRPSQEVHGLQHKVSYAKQLREKAKNIDKKIAHENERHKRGQSWMKQQEWRRLLDHRQQAWDEAEEVSRGTGYPFKDRDGEWVNCIQRDLVGVSLCSWCQQHGIEYC